MKRSIHLCRLLAVFLIAGLVFAPLATRADVDSILPAAMAAMAKTLQVQPSAGIAEIQPVTLRMLLPASDPEAESLGLSPPPRPPRSLVRPA